MKIGILTLPLNVNYGGILQAYALQTFLRNNGHEAEHIELSRTVYINDSIRNRIVKYPVRLLKKIFINHKITIRSEYKTNKIIRYTQKYTRPFIDQNLKIHYVDSYTNIKESDYDVFIVGSDQVWRPDYIENIENVFLDFTSNWKVKRIAYAVSFGKDALSFTENQKLRKADEKCMNLAKNFDSISVREESGVNICKAIYGRNAVCVLDPTLLLRREDYNLLINKIEPDNQSRLMTYVLDESPIINQLIKEAGNILNLEPINTNKSNVHNESVPLKERIQPPLENWLCGFRDCEAIITDSFHACVFSIIYNKPFVVVGNKQRGLSRFENLLSILGLEERLVDENVDVNLMCQLLAKEPNVIDKLNVLKEQSIKFLHSSLNM